jgi:hypothetical protein
MIDYQGMSTTLFRNGAFIGLLHSKTGAIISKFDTRGSAISIHNGIFDNIWSSKPTNSLNLHRPSDWTAKSEVNFQPLRFFIPPSVHWR